MPTRVSLPRFRFFFGPVTRFTVNITYALSFAFIMKRVTSTARIFVLRSWILYTLRVFGLILIFQIRASSPNFMPQCEAKTPPFYGRFRPRWYTVDVAKRLPSGGRSRVRFWTVTSLEDICKEPLGGTLFKRFPGHSRQPVSYLHSSSLTRRMRESRAQPYFVRGVTG